MPVQITVYDRGNPGAKPPEPAHEIMMWEVDAREAVKNDPSRYSLGRPKNFGAPPPKVPGRRPALAELDPAPEPQRNPEPGATET